MILDKIKGKISQSSLIRNYVEYKIKRDEIERFLTEADNVISRLNVENKEKLRKDYIADLHRYMFRFDEWYFQYDLSKADDNVKSEFISRSRAQKLYRSLVKKEVRFIFHNKPLFITKFKEGVSRNTLACRHDTDVSQISEIFRHAPLIVKPQAGSLGEGVFKLTKEQIAAIDLNAFLKEAIDKNYLIEECLVGCEEIQRFHPQSLNTIRVMTSFDGREYALFASFIRFGRGESVIDNAHGGGVYCTINIVDGTICINAYDTDGNVFECHPDTGIPFLGFQIPQWDKISELCIASHSKVDIPFVGWDVCVTPDGSIEFIEANHAPDIDVIQGPTKTGMAKRFEAVCRGYAKSKVKS